MAAPPVGRTVADVGRYLARKSGFYLITFVVAVTVDWAIPRFMPGDPIQGLISRMQAQPGSTEALTGYYTEAFGLDVPIWQQYLNFWAGLFQGDLGTSVWQYPRPVMSLILHAVPYTLALLVPATVLSFIAGNKVGALAARRKVLDNTVLPVSYVLTATPYMWLAIVLAYVFASVAGVFPLSGAYAYDLQPGWTVDFAGSFLSHWFLPFMSLFLVGFGGWAIGMRNMIIYELESDYSQYLASLGAPRRLVRRYAYRNAILPQVTGLALALGAVVGGALVTEVVFTYPGLGTMTLTAIQNRDYFLLQGIFIFIIAGVLIANFLVDIAYVLIDPRTRLGMQGSGS
jgi:peptide/nickel transport system permease protein